MSEPKLRKAVTAMCRDVDGIDWDAAAVQSDVNLMLAALHRASSAERSAALEVLVERIERARVEDADGVGYVALSAGTLVEHGAPARRLAQVLLAKLPDVLIAARRYADRCLADLRAADEGAERDDDGKAHIEIDGHAISREMFRAHLTEDRPGGAALDRLPQWVAPAVASLTRDRELLVRACANEGLREHAASLRDSGAHWLHVLLRTELGAHWLALYPLEERGFEITVDGVTSNFELHTLVAAALIERGLPGKAPPPALVAFLEGRAATAGVDYVEGVWSYYDWRAAANDLRAGTVPTDRWVWNEGSPQDVPMFNGRRTLLIGPPTIQRTWNPYRSFLALSGSVRFDAELPRSRVRSLLEEMAQASTNT